MESKGDAVQSKDSFDSLGSIAGLPVLHPKARTLSGVRLRDRDSDGVLGTGIGGGPSPVRIGSVSGRQAISTGSIMYDQEGSGVNLSAGGQFRPYSPSDEKSSPDPGSILRRKSSDALRSRAASLGGSLSSGSMLEAAAKAAKAAADVMLSRESQNRLELMKNFRVMRHANPYPGPRLVAQHWDWSARADVFRYLGWDVDYLKHSDDLSSDSLEDSYVNRSPVEICMLIAQSKADEIMARLKRDAYSGKFQYTEGCIVVTADQRVSFRDKNLSNCRSREEAGVLLQSYSGSDVKVVNALVLTHFPTGIQVQGDNSSTVHWQRLPSPIVLQAVEGSDSVLNCAGALIVEDPLMFRLIDRLDGTVDSVFGLPVQLLCSLLTRLEDQVLEASSSSSPLPGWDETNRDRAESKHGQSDTQTGTTTGESLGTQSKDSK